MSRPTMPHHPVAPQQGPARERPGLWQVPVAFWVGLGLSVVAFFVHISSTQVEYSTFGKTPTYSCTYSDLFGFAAAIGILGALVAGWLHRRSRHPNAKLPVSYMAVFSVVLVAMSAVHALRGNGTILSPCDAHPLP